MKRYLYLLLLLTICSPGFGYDCTNVFRDGVQTWSAGGVITMGTGTKVQTSGTVLTTGSIVNNTGAGFNNCTTAVCTATGTNSQVKFYTVWTPTPQGVDGAISVGNNTSVTYGSSGAHNYTTATVGTNSTLKLISNINGNSVEFSGNVTIGSGSTLELAGNADYDIKGNLQINANAIIKLTAATAGVVRIFVEGTIITQGGVTTSGFDRTQLLIFSNNNIDIGATNTLHAVIFAGKAGKYVHVGNGTTIWGAIAAPLDVTLGSSVTVGYDITKTTNSSYGAFCTPTDPVGQFVIDVGAGTGSNCSPPTISISAKDAAGNHLYNYRGTVNLSLSHANGDWAVTGVTGDNYGTLTPGSADSGSATYAFHMDDYGSITLKLTDNHTESGTISVNDATAGVTSTSGTLSNTRCTQQLGTWNFDQLSWNGTAGEVLDTSGNGYNGKAAYVSTYSPVANTRSGSPAYSSGLQSTCGYANFVSSATKFPYVELTNFPSLAYEFTIGAWIKPASFNYGRIVARDHNNTNGWALSLSPSGKVYYHNRVMVNGNTVTGGTMSAVGTSPFLMTSSVTLNTNTWYYVAITLDDAAKLVNIYVFDASGTLLGKTTGNYTGSFDPGTGTTEVGGSSTYSATYKQDLIFNGYIDEVTIYGNTLSQASILSMAQTARSCPSYVTYYGISHSGTGITCAGEPVTITAYNSANVPIEPPSGTVATLSTAPATSTWAGGNTYSFNGSVNSFVKYLQQTTPGSLNINVTDGSKVESGSIDPSITFVDSGFKFYGSSGLGAIPNQVSWTTDSAPILKAVRTDNNTGACVAQVTGAKTVKMAYVCRNPTTCVAGQLLGVNGTWIQSNPNASLANPTYSDVSLTFDGTGTASIPIIYSDVGQVRLFAKYDLPPSGNDPGKTLSASSNDFIVKPATLLVGTVQTVGAVSNPSGTSAAGTGAGFVSAGTAFKVNVEARNSGGGLTPNFGNETVSENNIQLTNLAIVYPTGGTATPLSGATTFTATAPAGTFTSSTVAWNQVGSFTVQARLADNDYLGAGDIPSPSTSSTIGRIYPDHFRVTASAATNGCGTFSYMGQPNLSYNYTLQAETTGNAVVTNYGGNYTTTTPAYVVENANGGNGTTLGSRFANGGAGSWSNGVYSFTSTAASFSRQASGAWDGPYTSLQLGLTLTDTFDARTITGLDMDATGTGSCAGCTAKALGGPLSLRYGRLRISDAFGPETVTLPVNFVTEYWTGNYFALNVSDSCTKVPRSAVSYPSGPISVDANRTAPLTGGTTQGMYGNLDASNINFSSGVAGHYFTVPTNGSMGSFVESVDMTNLSWLRYDWNQDGNYSDPTLPNANINFGSYRGHDRVVYWREKM